MFKIDGTKSQGCCYYAKCKLVNKKDHLNKYDFYINDNFFDTFLHFVEIGAIKTLSCFCSGKRKTVNSGSFWTCF